MNRVLRERDRLLRRSARSVALVADAVTIILLSLPGVASAPVALPVIAVTAALALVHVLLGSTGKRVWIVLSLLGSWISMVLLAALSGSDPDYTIFGIYSAINLGASCIAVFLVTTPRHSLLLIAAVILSLVLTLLPVPPSEWPLFALLTVLPWIALTFLGIWVRNSVPRVMRRIESIGQAHRVERQASETEAQRRQGARLLHDTVLATLTLLAHSGVGVSAAALRRQAEDDARLLRQLRLGATPVPSASGSYQLTTTPNAPIGQTLESVKSRFGRMGLDVIWHGSGQILLAGDVLDSFLLALSECLENVRRHSGVNSADVTITEDDTTVRAMVTDAGTGFDLNAVPAAKLGFKDSVVARLSDVGGNARLFSSPGAGTTVVLEVPK